MPRANRHFLAGFVWHITHRCHRRQFLLKFVRDRKRWLYWLFEARRRYDLCVLNYIVTSNHIHLLVRDRGGDEIARSMQLVAARTGQEYNWRKQRRGAYWQDRYHATAVDSGRYFARCMTYIDMNMVRTGVVAHPAEWPHCGYVEIQQPRNRYRIIDQHALIEIMEVPDFGAIQRWRTEAVADAVAARRFEREEWWSESVAVGSQTFVVAVQSALGSAAAHRDAETVDDGAVAVLRDSCAAYNSISRPKWAV